MQFSIIFDVRPDGKGVLSINVIVNGVDSRSLVLNC